MIETLLIANRGEIACRILRTCARLGIHTVAVYSDADTGARHTRLADEAIRIGPPPPGESYLAVEKIVAAAQRTGADAVHPGYGFLAENADFARACVAAGLLFVGPSAEAIETMGDKRAARHKMAAAGVPVIPGYDGREQSDEVLQREAARLGFPLMVKAAGGGGGKGMRIVSAADELSEALASARREAQAAFGTADLILERMLDGARHVEVQVCGDQHGHLIHLGERDCSLQRRFQKLIEEAPAPGLSAETRARLCAAAVAAARAVGYTNAGTVEFLLTADGAFYFLEMNTRIQVEHPVTELVTGIDLVEWQLRVAEGEPLPRSQPEVQQRGHAIEARLYAEDAARGFLPVAGDVLLWREPRAPGVRVDSSLQNGEAVSIHYDPLLAKVVAHGPDRATALRRLARALDTTVLLGLKTNLDFLRAVVRDPEFRAAKLDTQLVGRHVDRQRLANGDERLALIACAAAEWRRHTGVENNVRYWRNNPNAPHRFRFQIMGRDEACEVGLEPMAANVYRVYTSDSPDGYVTVSVEEEEENGLVLTADGHRQRVVLGVRDDEWWVHTRAGVVALRLLPRLAAPQPSAEAGGSLRAPMPGVVLQVLVEVGQRVSKGQPLMKLEAMKMEHTIRGAADGIVETIHYAPGEQVAAGAQLLRIRHSAGLLDKPHDRQ